MPAAEYPKALAAVLVHEGGYVNDPRDPGGETNKGVTWRVYDGYRSTRGEPKRSVKEMTKTELEEIYRLQYWNVIKGDYLPDGVAYAVFDGAVNSGPAQAVKWLQRALGLSVVDGNLGTATLAAAIAHPDHDQLIADMLNHRLAFLKRLKTWATYGKGWTRRVLDVRRRAQAWADGTVGPPIGGIEKAGGKARIEDAKPAPSTLPADAMVAAGTANGGVAGTLQGTREQLEPLAGTSNWIATTVAVLSVVTAVLLIGGFAWRWWQTRKAKEHAEALA